VAVGTATPEPPNWGPHRGTSVFARWRAWFGVAGLLVVAGLGGLVLSRTAELRAVSWTVIAFGIGTGALPVWIAVVTPILTLRRRTRWIRTRQAVVGPRPDHPPNDR
jgi:hypothetical protein